MALHILKITFVWDSSQQVIYCKYHKQTIMIYPIVLLFYNVWLEYKIIFIYYLLLIYYFKSFKLFLDFWF